VQGVYAGRDVGGGRGREVPMAFLASPARIGRSEGRRGGTTTTNTARRRRKRGEEQETSTRTDDGGAKGSQVDPLAISELVPGLRRGQS
jgi:hypothetical protein